MRLSLIQILALLLISTAVFAQGTQPLPKPSPAPAPPKSQDGVSNAERDCMGIIDQGARARCLERAQPQSTLSEAARTCADLPSQAARAQCFDRITPGAGSSGDDQHPVLRDVPPAEIIERDGSGSTQNVPPPAAPPK